MRGTASHHPIERIITHQFTDPVIQKVRNTRVWTQAIMQTCVVHLLRASFRYAARQDWDKISKALKPVYTAPTEDAATERFLEFSDAWGGKYPAIVRLWENA